MAILSEYLVDESSKRELGGNKESLRKDARPAIYLSLCQFPLAAEIPTPWMDAFLFHSSAGHFAL